MRHIPEEELHAYLDQALSRSQCVEIESHLAGCSRCQSTRDAIAALRDRTTALLAQLAPPRTIPPAFDALRARHAAAAAHRQHRRRNVAWAASLLLAVGVGWSASHLSLNPAAADPATVLADRPVAVHESIAPVDSAPAARPPAFAANDTPQAGSPEADGRTAGSGEAGHRAAPAPSRAPRLAIEPPAIAPTPVDSAGPRLKLPVVSPAVQVSSGRLPGMAEAPSLEGMWRTLSWDGARAEAGGAPAHIDGLPVAQVQVQRTKEGAQPIMVVTQQLKSGQVIRTIEGPAADVSSLLARQNETGELSPWPMLGSDVGAAIQSRDGATALWNGDRILAITGQLPSDSLLAMIRRLNVERRGKE